jgi:hypothetical protein
MCQMFLALLGIGARNGDAVVAGTAGRFSRRFLACCRSGLT